MKNRLSISFQQLYGLFKKEVQLQSRYRFVILHRMLIGPTISALSTAALFIGVFKISSSISLGGITNINFKSHLLCGFLIHTYLNSGYYFLCTKLSSEWEAGTLPLLWILPSHPFMKALGLCLVEALRCFSLTALCYLFSLFADPGFHPTIFTTSTLVLFFIPLFTMGVAWGFIKSIVSILNGGSAEFLDYIYMVFLFTGCLYIPKALIPEFLQPLCYLNPIFHEKTALTDAWTGNITPDFGFHLLMISGGTVLCVLACALLWKISRFTVQEKSFI